eukprot:CAMPEP_0171844956 /NCGR_PEP_ID=MMETSP0992-20121227/16815_2 /TAXON_ID=483369 /ORGANISM="non described non described, Strain CCMP2098" /LENGTH=111 /DNA_ID=CAMNT_0012462925 /DNA_START=526 /DNA_END=859 /DNA_ORIENTATION=-
MQKAPTQKLTSELRGTAANATGSAAIKQDVRALGHHGFGGDFADQVVVELEPLIWQHAAAARGRPFLSTRALVLGFVPLPAAHKRLVVPKVHVSVVVHHPEAVVQCAPRVR